MIEFLTLFLGLTRGPQLVELDVVGPVAEVEVRLDGEALATLTAPPWLLEVDLGQSLLPHDLVAEARDAEGRVLDRTEQWINVSLSRAEARMAFESDEQGRPEAVRVIWESIGQTRLEDVEIEFDGRTMPVDDPERVPLPDHRPDDFHYVSGSVRIAGRPGEEVTERLATDYGGPRSAEISTELTAVAVVLDKHGGLPSAARMGSWFVKDGRPLKVHGVERGDADLIVVRASGSQPALDALAKEAYSSVISTREAIPGLQDWDPAKRFAAGPRAADRDGPYGLVNLSRFAPLDSEIRVHWVSPHSGTLSPRGIEPGTFVRSRDLSSSEGVFLQLARSAEPVTFTPKIAEAVALGGILAHSDNRRRAVVLILGGDEEDESKHSAAIARDYLHALRVPLVVWTVGSGVDRGDWTEAVDLGDTARPQRALRGLQAAVDDLQRGLRRQRIVWLEGRHLPQKIELGPAARGIRLAGER